MDNEHKPDRSSHLPWLCTGDMMRFWTSCILPDGLPIIAPVTVSRNTHQLWNHNQRCVITKPPGCV